MNLYRDYMKEREGGDLVYNDKGFATYKEIKVGEIPLIYIVNIFAKKEYRKTGVASSLADQIAKIAESKGIKYLLGSVDPKANGATDSMKALLAYGFTLSYMDERLIYLKKGI